MSAHLPCWLVHLDGPEDPRLNWLREQLKNAAWQRLSVILLTAGDPRPLWREALALNLTDVLAKPLDESALLLKLRQCLGLRIYRDRLLRQDLLTGLTNHTGFMRRLESVLRSTPRACTLMLLDLDRFRQLNDGLGHAIGDAFLKAVSQRLDGIWSAATPAPSVAAAFAPPAPGWRVLAPTLHGPAARPPR